MPEKPQRKKRRPYSEEDLLHLRRSGRYVPPDRPTLKQKLVAATLAPLKMVEKRLIEPLASLVDKADLFRILEKVGFLIVMLVFLIEFGERREKSIYEAWNVVKDGKDQQSGVVRLALERLRKEEFSLSEINVKGSNLNRIELGCNHTIKNFSVESICTNLYGANLSGVNLWRANLSGAVLNNANLSGANFNDANLTEAHLNGANLSNANLGNANLSDTFLIDTNLSDAYFEGANLSDAYLWQANLSGADLRFVENLTPEQVKQAKNWEKAKYNEEFRKQLGLPPELSK
ncbi:pentapeptide repeat-containing protein [Scytonema sp. NUACC26]|uniref:pentapeptide repeat-containing protein n=1 Tax=Scytonema sp. NUACC26 TaxID=3140176 RepID=UPI0034DC7B8A